MKYLTSVFTLVNKFQVIPAEIASSLALQIGTHKKRFIPVCNKFKIDFLVKFSVAHQIIQQ